MNPIRRPSEIIGRQNVFGNNEVGLTHPVQPSYIKLADNGDVYIMANPNLGIIMNSAKNSITLVADKIKFITNPNNEALGWNDMYFNHKATSYTEPTLITPPSTQVGIFDGIDQFLESE